jgi:hypothetical protein
VHRSGNKLGVKLIPDAGIPMMEYDNIDDYSNDIIHM